MPACRGGLYGSDHRGFLTANEGSRAFHDVNPHLLAAAENVVAQSALGYGGLYSFAHATHGQRVLSANVNVALIGADGTRGDHQALKHAVRIAFHHAAVHEGSGIALVTVADHILFDRILLTGSFPLASGGKSATTAATESRFQNEVADGLRIHLQIGFARGLVASRSNKLFDIFGIDDTALLQHHAGLPLVKRNIQGAWQRLRV